MFDKTMLGYVFMAFSAIPLGFLIYTLTRLGKLGITIMHPRVVAELILFLSFLLIGSILNSIIRKLTYKSGNSYLALFGFSD